MTSVQRPRLLSLATLVAAAVVFVGCDSNSTQPVSVSCADLNGSFASTTLALESVENPDVRETFGGEASLRFEFNAPYFRSLFVGPEQDSLRASGFFAVDEGSDPTRLDFGRTRLIAGSDSSAVSFECASDGTALSLRSDDLDYDIDKNGETEATRLNADFDLVAE